MRDINWTAIIITVILCGTFFGLVRGCAKYQLDQDQQMIDAGYRKENKPSGYSEMWVKP